MRFQDLHRALDTEWCNLKLWFLQYGRYLLFFLAILAAGTALVLQFYPEKLRLTEALYGVFTRIFFQPEVIEFDKAPTGLQYVLILIPLVGLLFIAPGVLRSVQALLDPVKRKENRLRALASTYRDHIIVCGLGRIGYRVMNELLDWGEKVIGIENDSAAPFLEEIRQRDVPVLIGDARQEEMLEEARVRQASAIVVCTEDDSTNMEVAIEARELNRGIKVVMRMFNERLAKRVRKGFDIKTAFSTSALAAPVFAAAATRARISHSFYVDEEEDLMIARMTVNPDSVLEGRTVAQAEKELHLSIILHKREDRLDSPADPGAVIRTDDCLVVYAARETLACLGDRSRRRSPPLEEI